MVEVISTSAVEGRLRLVGASRASNVLAMEITDPLAIIQVKTSKLGGDGKILERLTIPISKYGFCPCHLVSFLVNPDKVLNLISKRIDHEPAGEEWRSLRAIRDLLRTNNNA